MRAMKPMNPRRAHWAAIVTVLLCVPAYESSGEPWTATAEVVHTDLRVGIGTHAPHAQLAVKGTIAAQEVKVSVDDWPDYVFDEGYPLIPLRELGARVRSEGHLPGIPDAGTVASEGVELGAAQRLLLQKVEELTLYVLELERSNSALSERVAELEDREARR